MGLITDVTAKPHEAIAFTMPEDASSEKSGKTGKTLDRRPVQQRCNTDSCLLVTGLFFGVMAASFLIAACVTRNASYAAPIVLCTGTGVLFYVGARGGFNRIGTWSSNVFVPRSPLQLIVLMHM